MGSGRENVCFREVRGGLGSLGLPCLDHWRYWSFGTIEVMRESV